jgi:hypothetical protein
MSGEGKLDFDEWWDSDAHGWGPERLAEYRLAKDAWNAANTAAEAFARAKVREFVTKASARFIATGGGGMIFTGKEIASELEKLSQEAS